MSNNRADAVDRLLMVNSIRLSDLQLKLGMLTYEQLKDDCHVQQEYWIQVLCVLSRLRKENHGNYLPGPLIAKLLMANEVAFCMCVSRDLRRMIRGSRTNSETEERTETNKEHM